MSWYYADAGQQAGPVDDAQFDALVRSGKITPDTLVWCQGMAEWKPLRTVRPASAASAASAPPTVTAGGGQAVITGHEIVCVECGKMFPRSEAIQYGTTWVCANCKPTFIQKVKEGITPAPRRGRRSLPVDAQQLTDEILSRGVEVNIGQCVSRAWELMKSNFGLMLGTTVLVILCMQAAGIIPILGACIGLVLDGPLMGGLYLFYLKLIRGEPATVGDGFSGFKRFGPLLLVFVLMMILIYLPFVPVAVYGGVTGQFDRQSPDALFVILAIAGFLAMMYLAISFFYAIPLVADLELGAWEALQVSRRVVNRRFFAFLGLGVVGCLIMLLGLLALCFGVLVAMPVTYAMWMYAYEDVFGAGPEVPLT
jgi:uncharacterized protein DUF4339